MRFRKNQVKEWQMKRFKTLTKQEYIREVRQGGYYLRFIKEKDQDKEICKEAVKQYGDALQYVAVALQDEEICKEAVKQDGDALLYVENYYASITKLRSNYMRDYIKEFVTKELTVEQVSELLGYKVKIKGD